MAAKTGETTENDEKNRFPPAVTRHAFREEGNKIKQNLSKREISARIQRGGAHRPRRTEGKDGFMNKEQETRALSTEVRRPPKRENPIARALREGIYRRRERNGEVLIDLAALLFSALFAATHTAFGVYPLSLALLLCAGARVLPIFVGGALGCGLLGGAGTLYLALHILAFGYRLLVSYPRERRHLPASAALFCEAPALRVLGGVLLGVGMALYELILFGVQRYTLLFAAGATLLLPLCCLLFSFALAQGWTLSALLGRASPPAPMYFGRHAPFLFSLGAVSLLFAAALSLRPYYFFGISLAKCATVAFTLFVSRRFGATKGCAVGLLVGLAGEPIYLPAFGILGLLSGLYVGIGMPLSLAAAVLAGGGYAVYVGGMTGFLSVVPEMTVTSLLLWIPLRYVPTPDKTGTLAGKGGESEATNEAPSRPERDSVACLSGALATVSEQLKAAAGRESTPSPEEFEALCLAVKERVCRRCPAEGACEEQGTVKDCLRGTVLRLSLGEGVGECPTPPCEGYGKMIEEIRREAAALAQRKRLGGAVGALSVDYALLSELLQQIAEADRREATEDAEAEAALREALAEHGITAQEVRVVGARHRILSLSALRGDEGRSVESEWVEEACVRACGRSVAGVRFRYEAGLLCATAESRPAFSAEAGAYTLAGQSGECAADRAQTVTSDGGMVYAMVCDGMGSGQRAAEMAALGVSVLSALLSAGVDRQMALALLNNAICTAKEECAVALDLLSLDLYEGRAGFLKSGAAASFVYRDGALFRIRSRTIPLGLLRVVDSEEAGFEVRAGDIMVLLSDGVLGDAEDGAWLKDVLAQGGESGALARRIVTRAAERGSSADDKTALVLRVCAAPTDTRA